MSAADVSLACGLAQAAISTHYYLLEEHVHGGAAGEIVQRASPWLSDAEKLASWLGTTQLDLADLSDGAVTEEGAKTLYGHTESLGDAFVQELAALVLGHAKGESERIYSVFCAVLSELVACLDSLLGAESESLPKLRLRVEQGHRLRLDLREGLDRDAADDDKMRASARTAWEAAMVKGSAGE